MIQIALNQPLRSWSPKRSTRMRKKTIRYATKTKLTMTIQMMSQKFCMMILRFECGWEVCPGEATTGESRGARGNGPLRTPGEKPLVLSGGSAAPETEVAGGAADGVRLPRGRPVTMTVG